MTPESTLECWQKNYPLPSALSEDIEFETTKLIRYSPPISDRKGLCIAFSILGLFILFWYHALFEIDLNRSYWFDIIGTFCILEFLYTGLFITCHDAMHGAVSYRHRRLNNAIGHICFSIYAWFDYRRMHEKHWRHHNHTGIVHRDPDFHNGQSASLFPWYCNFMWEYFSIVQIIKVGIWANFLMYTFSVAFANVVVYMLVCGVCSSFRLFYFGTYLPHRPWVIDGQMEKTMPWRKSRSSNANRLISFLCCYHFDYHWEHHRWPYAPWWDLWKCKEIRQKSEQFRKDI